MLHVAFSAARQYFPAVLLFSTTYERACPQKRQTNGIDDVGIDGVISDLRTVLLHPQVEKSRRNNVAPRDQTSPDRLPCADIASPNDLARKSLARTSMMQNSLVREREVDMH